GYLICGCALETLVGGEAIDARGDPLAATLDGRLDLQGLRQAGLLPCTDQRDDRPVKENSYTGVDANVAAVRRRNRLGDFQEARRLEQELHRLFHALSVAAGGAGADEHPIVLRALQRGGRKNDCIRLGPGKSAFNGL